MELGGMESRGRFTYDGQLTNSYRLDEVDQAMKGPIH